MSAGTAVEIKKTLESTSANLLLVTTTAKQCTVRSHTHSRKLVTKATRALLRMEHLYWEPWRWTRGSLHDAATHAGRCSSIMRHFITERQPLASI